MMVVMVLEVVVVVVVVVKIENTGSIISYIAIPAHLLSGQPSMSGGGVAAGRGNVTAVLTDPRYRRPLWVGLSLMLFQQITGQPTVL
jgi:hypothetical protein